MENKTKTDTLDWDRENETWREMRVRKMFEEYDGTLITGIRFSPNTLPAENHSFVRFDISTEEDLMKEIEEKFVKPVNEYFTEKNGSPYLNDLMKRHKYKGYTDVGEVFDYIFRKSIQEFEMFAEQDNLWEKLVKKQKVFIDDELEGKSQNKVA